MDKDGRVKRLYSKVFSVSKTEDWDKKGASATFTCPYASDCQVDPTKEAIWSPALGDTENDVMVVAEAPSTAGGTGAHIGGLTRDWSKGEKGGAEELLHFVRTRFKSNPHFTDVMKCGIAKQSREMKRVFRQRERRCMEEYLLKEIEIVAPRVILCVGKTASRTLKKRQNKGDISSSIKLVELLHYSSQANLPVSIMDKLNIIWPIQLGDGDVKAADLSYLNQKSHFKSS